ncbi:MAG: 2-oxoglutarate ferredoxin oxidoreductase subunit delta [Clostridia bacterium]|jgi:2-oxoglutarate ferredoxin oxidoreductase subunit delta|nr:2-oxoglutarate ferredoxin oxidoreductase subunit delta [Clostridia bacterium]MDN5321689.1 2-oxoglutarate ferredoxin oxidoreductase subunit delta [Clostridia bacterium]
MGSIKIREERCKGCTLCINACPQKIITLASYTNSKGYYPATLADEDTCTGCGSCYTFCPDMCIEVYR